MTAETVDPPFTAFNFEVVLTLSERLPGVGSPVCQGAFAECDGLQLDLEPKSMVQGGATDSVTHLAGQTRPGQLTLRRGMTTTTDLWAWVAGAGIPGRAVTADGIITMYDGTRNKQAAFVVRGCLPVRLRGPALNAQTGLVAVEELGLAVGHLALEGAGGDGGLDIGVSAGFSAGVSGGGGIGIGGGIGAGIGAGAQVSGGLGLSGSLGGTVSGSASGGIGLGVG